MDAATLKTAWARSQPHFFAPLGNMPHFAAIGIPSSHVHLLDWWEESAVSVALPASAAGPADEGRKEKSAEVKASFVLTCTPSQHTANRSAFDRWHTLWASWAVTESLPPHPDEGASPRREPKRVYFAGDTGYRTVREGEDEHAAPVCPAFKEIGEKFGGVDLALLPIGCVFGF